MTETVINLGTVGDGLEEFKSQNWSRPGDSGRTLEVILRLRSLDLVRIWGKGHRDQRIDSHATGTTRSQARVIGASSAASSGSIPLVSHASPGSLQLSPHLSLESMGSQWEPCSAEHLHLSQWQADLPTAGISWDQLGRLQLQRAEGHLQ